MFPELSLDDAVEEEKKPASIEQGRTFLYDFDKGDFVVKDGRLVEVDNKEAVRVWIEKAFKTDKFKFEVYEEDEGVDEYGTILKKLIQGRKVPQFFLQSEIKREVEELLQKNIEIDRMENFRTDQKGAALYIYFTVILKSNDSLDMEVEF